MLHLFDGGANVGQTFDQYILEQPELLNARIWCFEPSPRHLHRLLEKSDELGGRLNIVICPFALLDINATMTFYEKIGDPLGDSLDRDRSAEKISKRRIVVATVSTAEFILGNTGLGDEVILKLDVEAHIPRVRGGRF